MRVRSRGFGLVAFAATSALAAMLVSSTAPVRADNLGGRFTVCGQVVNFVAPSDVGGGSFTLVGIGPGLHNEPGDETSHHFPIAPDIALQPDVRDELRALADGLSFTCLALTAEAGADPGLLLVRSIVLDRQVDVCGAVTRDRLGVFSIAGDLHPTSLVADAASLLDDFEGWRLLGLLTEAAESPDRPALCLHIELGSDGVVESISVDAGFGYCDRVLEGAYLMVGQVYLWPDDLLPEATRRALQFIGRAGGEACWSLEVVDSRLLGVEASAYQELCGRAGRDDFGAPAIEGVVVTADVVPDERVGDLGRAADAGGTACIWVSIDGNSVASDLSVTVPSLAPAPTRAPAARPTAAPTRTAAPEPAAPPAPAAASPTASQASASAAATASPSPSPSRSSNPSPSPSPTRAPSPSPVAAIAPVVPAGDDGPWTPVLLVLLAVLVAAAGYAVRRARAESGRPDDDAADSAGPRGPGLDLPSLGGSATMAVPAGAASLAASAQPVIAAPSAGTAAPDPAAARLVERAGLTAREREVLSMLTTGMSNRRIGEALFIAESTAGVHVSNIMGKLGASTRTEAAAIAHRAGLAHTNRTDPRTTIH